MADDALDLLTGLRLEDGRRWGEVAAPFQWEDARHVLDQSSPAPYSFLTRARGGSKTSDLAGVAIAAMLAQAPAAARLYGLAADRDQGRLLVDAVAGFVARTPELAGALDVGAYRVTALRSGAVLDVLAADASGAWGTRPWLTIVDEVAQWAETGSARRLWEATTSAVAKIPGARMVVLTTAGSPSHWSAKVRDHALEDPLWHLHEVAGPPPWLDRERLAEQRRRLPESVYARLFLNQWVESEDALVNPDDLAACVTLEGPLPPQPGVRYVLGVDLGIRRDRTVALVCHSEPVPRVDGDGVGGIRVLLDRIERWRGSRLRPVKLDEVQEWIFEASQRYNRARVVLDPWQAMGLAQRLRARGVQVEEFTFSSASVGRIASTLHVLLRNRLLALPEDEDLLDELQRVRLRETSPGVVRLDHDPDAHDDQAVALALAAHDLASRPASDGWSIPKDWVQTPDYSGVAWQINGREF